MKPVGFLVLLALFWMLLSGHTQPLLIFLGVVSVGLTFYLAKRMNVIDHESYPLQISSKLPLFYIYILQQIVLANIDVIKRIVKHKGKDISPTLVDIPIEQTTDLGRVIYANSITLTPGTVTIELHKDKAVVHALSKEGAQDLLRGDMTKSIPESRQD